MKPRPHADLIKAWADGAKIQFKCCGDGGFTWLSISEPSWSSGTEYRIKPVNTVYYATFEKLEKLISPRITCIFQMTEDADIPEGLKHNLPNLKLVMNDEGKLISAEVI